MTLYRYGTETSDTIKKKVRVFAILVVISFNLIIVVFSNGMQLVVLLRIY